MALATTPDRRVSHDRHAPVRPAIPPVSTFPPPTAGTTFVEGRDARVAGGVMVVSAAGLLGLLSVGGVLLAALELLDGLPGQPAGHVFSAAAPPGSSDPPGASAVARTNDGPAPGPDAVRAARGAGDAGPRALAPEVAPVLPASGAVTPVPRGGDGPPEESLESAR